MILNNICITFQMDAHEENKFVELLIKDQYHTDWSRDKNFVEVDMDGIERCILYDVHFDSLEGAKRFYTDINDAFERIV